METISNQTQSVLLEHVCSMEFYQKEGSEPRQVLSDINLNIHQGEVWGIIGESAFELRLLLEIIANARPYQDGRCVLNQRGMMRKKRIILPHLFYIGSTNMLFDNMNVLEYLMFITAKQKGDVVERQKKIFQDLLDHDMDYLSLSAIHHLTPDERALVTLLTAYYTESDIIVLNLARLSYQERTLCAMEKVSRSIQKAKRTLIFSSFDTNLIQRISTHTAVMKQGVIAYQGTTSEFIDTWDHLSIVLEDPQIERFVTLISTNFPNVEMHQKAKRLEIWDVSHDATLYHQLFSVFTNAQCYPNVLYQHTNCVENAWKEIKEHDL